MLKSTFKKVSAIAIAGTMLAGMMAVPANAMSSVTKTEKVTTTAISDNFNRYTANTYKSNITATPQTFSENSRIQYSNYNTSGDYPGARTLTVAEREDISGDKYMKFDTWVGLNLNIDADKTYTVNPGDVVKIKFKYNYKNTSTQKIHVNLNNDDTRYQGKEGGTNNGAMWWDAGAKDYGPNKGRIATIAPKAAAIAEDTYGAISSPAETWNEMEITINTKDSAYNNQQTLTVKIGENYLKGLFDANYGGSGDNTWNLLSEINSIQFLSYTKDGANDGNYFAIDDLSITVTGDREVDELVSDLSKTLVDEDFSDLSTTGKSNGWNGTQDNKKQLAGTSFRYCAYGSDGSMVGSYPTTTETEKALKISSTTGRDHHYALYVNTNETTLVPGDIINMSFDCYQTEANIMYVMLQGLQDKGVRYKSIRAKNWYKDSGSGTWVPVQSKAESTKDNVATIAITGTNRNDGNQKPTMLAPVYAHSGANTAQYTFTPEKWYTIEISINTKDPAHENKQTMTLRYKERGTNTYLQEYVGYLDTDTTNDTSGDVIDALTTFKGFDIALLTVKDEDTETYIDNVKAEILSPGFEVVDVNNSTNTYTFSGTTPINLNYVTNASAASKVIIAQYDNTGRLISATPQAVAATGRDTVTVTPVANANLIKLMILDMESAVPYAKVFKLTKSGN